MQPLFSPSRPCCFLSASFLSSLLLLVFRSAPSPPVSYPYLLFFQAQRALSAAPSSSSPPLLCRQRGPSGAPGPPLTWHDGRRNCASGFLVINILPGISITSNERSPTDGNLHCIMKLGTKLLAAVMDQLARM